MTEVGIELQPMSKWLVESVFLAALAARAAKNIVDRPTQLICTSDIYLLSWRW